MLLEKIVDNIKNSIFCKIQSIIKWIQRTVILTLNNVYPNIRVYRCRVVRSNIRVYRCRVVRSPTRPPNPFLQGGAAHDMLQGVEIIEILRAEHA